MDLSDMFNFLNPLQKDIHGLVSSRASSPILDHFIWWILWDVFIVTVHLTRIHRDEIQANHRFFS